MDFVPFSALVVIALAVLAVVRGAEVRLTLFLAALVIGAFAERIDVVLRMFLDTFCDEKFVLPICSAMGFAYVIRHSGCDRHLVRLLMAPVRRSRTLAIPGVVLAAFIVNIPVISQTSTAVCVGPVALPLLRAAGFSPLASAATLTLGASVGGELLNPGAPELQTITKATGTDSTTLARTVFPPLLFPYLAAATLTHWLLVRKRQPKSEDVPPAAVEEPRINFVKAAVPLVPLAILFITGPPYFLIPIPKELLSPNPTKFDARLIAVAMMLGVAAAALAAPRFAAGSLKQFFEGAGYGFAAVVSLIVTANCFGEAIKLAGLAKLLESFITSQPSLLIPLAALVPWAFAFICGSGMASTQSLFGFFHGPAANLGENPDSVGAVVSIASAAGRTMSPVSAVMLMVGSMTETKPFAIVKALALPLAAGLIVVILLRMMRWPA